MSALESPIAMSGAHFQTEPLADLTFDDDLQRSALDSFFSNANTNIVDHYSQLLPEVADLAKVKVEPMPEALEAGNVGMTGFNGADLHLTSHLLSSIRKRIFLDINTDNSADFDISHSTAYHKDMHEINKAYIAGDSTVQQVENMGNSLQLDHGHVTCMNMTNTSPGVGSQLSCSMDSTPCSPSYTSMSQSCSPDSSSSHHTANLYNETMNCYSGLSPDSVSAHQSLYSCGYIGNGADFVTTTDTGNDRGPGMKCGSNRRCMLKSRHLLPPCRVCGDNASGFHYGANTCEACKGFFRRSLKKETIEYKCTGNHDCVIQKGRRNNCPLCRYNKCLNIGMSKEAIKTGRYTHEKRTQDIVEVKQLNGDPVPEKVTSPVHIKSEFPTRGLPRQPMSEENKTLLGDIYAAHKASFISWHKTLDSGTYKRKIKQYAETYPNKRKRILKAASNVSSDGTDSNLQTTDTDSPLSDCDNNVKNITKDSIVKHLELVVMTFVKFAKSIPGFTDLPLNDQATLVKLARFEMWMIGAHKFIDCDRQIVSGPLGKTYHLEELQIVLDKEFMGSVFDFARTLQGLSLTKEETTLLQTIALTFSDRTELQEASSVEGIQFRLVSCLKQLMPNCRRFAKCMDVLVRLRDLTEMNTKISENLLSKWPHIRQHPLLFEIMSVGPEKKILSSDTVQL